MDYNVDNEPVDFDKLIIEIYDAALTRKWGRVLAKCNQVFQAGKTFLLLRDVVNEREVALRIKVQENATHNPDALDSLSSLSTYKPLFLKLHEGDLFDTSEESFRLLKDAPAFIEHILAPLDAEKMLGALVLRDARYEAYLGICRTEQEDGFSNFEHVAFKRLIPHFIRAARFFRDEEVFRQQRHLAQGLYDHIKTAFVVCNGKLEVQAFNAQADAYFSESGVLAVKNRKLTFFSPVQQQRFTDKVNACLSAAGRSASTEQVHVVDDNVDKIEIFHIHKLGSQAEGERREAMAVVNIQCRSRPDWKNVQSCYALNKKEILIARMLYKDTPFEDIAVAVNLPEDDVREHVNHILKAVNVRNEEALIRKLSMFAQTLTGIE